MSASTPTDHLAAALSATDTLVAGIGDDQWSNPTPCQEWNVRALVSHLVLGNRLFASAVRGEPPPQGESLKQLRTADQLGDTPLCAYREAGAELLDAFSQPSALERTVQIPVGQVSGAVALHLRITELLVHGWDLATATGQLARFPDELAEQELAFASSKNAPDVPRTGHPFGPIQSVPDDAPAIDRLAAYLGRPVSSDRTT